MRFADLSPAVHTPKQGALAAAAGTENWFPSLTLQSTKMQDFEKLGSFYLGRKYDLDSGTASGELVLYDAKDLTTHAVCVGMTGSGKTGLCLALLEEAAIDGIPAICIDPKGDLGNLCLAFPELSPAQFAPWIDPASAEREGISVEQLAAKEAEKWKKGLADWGQTPERIAKFRQSVDLNIYTPGSSAGRPLSILKSFSAPRKETLEDADAFRERVTAAASGLLALLGIEADPVRSREHILIANLLERAWRAGKDMDLGTLIREIQAPPITRIGIVDLEMFFPEKDRMDLAMQLNALLASPSFAGWLEGEPLDIRQMLYTAEGKPRMSILYTAHLSESERLFFVTILLNEFLAWVRAQPGTSSLRALLYMDEVFGYFPPTANPPTKQPMLTLLKQARAFGVGVVLATQNPIDLDYRGLSNTGTWFLGRLQTERDKLRVLDGLEGASAQSGAAFDRQKMDRVLSGLKSRTFLLHNVHEDEPVVFQSRWALSYLRGPLTREQIRQLMQAKKAADANKMQAGTAAAVSAAQAAGTAPTPASTPTPGQAPAGQAADPFQLSPVELPSAGSAAGLRPAAPTERGSLGQPMLPTSTPASHAGMGEAAASYTGAMTPAAVAVNAALPGSMAAPLLPREIPQLYLACKEAAPAGKRVIYVPALLGRARIHYAQTKYRVDVWQSQEWFMLVQGDLGDSPWETAKGLVPDGAGWAAGPVSGGSFAELPSLLSKPKSYDSLEKQLKAFLYRTQAYLLWTNPALKEISAPDESQAEFRIRMSQKAHEVRDMEVEKLRSKYAAQVNQLKTRLRTAQERAAREQSQYHQQGLEGMLSLGESIVGAIFGRKLVSKTNARKAATSMKRIGKAAKERSDASRAEDNLTELQEQYDELAQRLQEEVDALALRYQAAALEMLELPIRPKKTDVETQRVSLVWCPYFCSATGQMSPGFDLPYAS